MIALTFALPDESRGFRGKLTGRQSHATDRWHRLPIVTGRRDERFVAVVHTGVGEIGFYRRRLESFLAKEKPRLLISSGYAGGLQPGLAAGDLVLGENVSNAEILRTAQGLLTACAPRTGALISRPEVAESARGKRTLGTNTGALAVDMETRWIAAACAAGGVPMLSLRAISDAVEEAFPVPGHVLFDSQRQRPRYAALPLWLLCHPARIKPFARFVRGVGLAQRRMTDALQTLAAGL